MEKIKTVAYLRYGCSDGESTSELVRRDTGFYRAFCEEKGMELVDVYFDHASGNCKERLGLKKLMDDSQTGKFERVITKQITKLSRDTEEQINIIRQLNENGISLWSEMEGGLIGADFIKILLTMPKETFNSNSFIDSPHKEDELDEMLAHLDRLNHRLDEEDESAYDTEVEIRVGEKSVRFNLDEEVFGVLYDMILSMRGEL